MNNYSELEKKKFKPNIFGFQNQENTNQNNINFKKNNNVFLIEIPIKSISFTY